MASAPQIALEQRIKCDEQILATLEAHTAQLQKARTDTLTTLSSAQATLAGIDAELAEAGMRKASTRDSILALRSSLRRRQADTLPLELLREIFLFIAAQEDEFWTVDSMPEINSSRSLQPFALAAVCSRWRTLALATPILWHYIAIPPPGAQPERFAYYYPYWIRTLLRRSKGSYIDVLLLWREDETCVTEGSYASIILNLLVQHASRWRRFEFHLPTKFVTMDSFAIFRHPTPALERFCLVSSDSSATHLEWSPSFPRFLPVCPRLTVFQSFHNNLVIAVLPSTPHEHLVRLEIYVKVPCAVIWSIMASAPALQTFDIQFSDEYSPDDVDVVPSTSILFKALTQLRLGDVDAIKMFSTSAPLLSMPLLKILDVVADFDGLEPFLRSHGTSVEELGITNAELDLDALPSLKALPNVCDVRIAASTLQDELLQAMAVGDESLLPKLRSLHLSEVDIEPQDGDGLAHLVRSRTLTRNSQLGGMEPKHSTLSSVTIRDSPRIPRWLVTEISYLLGEEIPVSEDDSVLDGAPEEVAEAQFTDAETISEEECSSSDDSDDSWVDSDDSSEQEGGNTEGSEHE